MKLGVKELRLMNTRVTRRHANSGFTLVELLVGVLLGLILLAGVVQVYITASEVNRERQSMSAVTENVRFALQHMTRQLRRADSVTWDAGAQEIQATLHGTGAVIGYRLRQDGNRWWIDFRRDGGNYEKLVSGISAWEFQFGEYVPGNETIEYHDTPTGSVVSLRVGVTPYDDTRDFNELELESWQDASGSEARIWATIGLRNPTIVAIQ